MNEFDEGSVYSTHTQRVHIGDAMKDNQRILPSEAKKRFVEFIRAHHEGHIYKYRERLLHNYRKKKYMLTVNLGDLANFDTKLKDLLQEQPAKYLAQLEFAAQEVLESIEFSDNTPDKSVPRMQVCLESGQHALTQIRSINASHVHTLLKVPGIVISQTKTRPKAVAVHIRCSKCNHSMDLPVTSAFGSVSLPRACSNSLGDIAAAQDCGIDPYVVIPDRSTYVDQQTLKLQECPEDVPTGEMPRHILLSVDRNLAGQVAPGTRVSIMGVSSIFSSSFKKKMSAVAIRTPYLKVVGMSVESEGSGRARTTITPKEEENFIMLSRQKNIYEKICNSIAPSISGHYTVDIKKAIACLLFGGSRKKLPDGMKLRGDINVLLLGDPSTAKSQFLKFVEKVAPIGVYTSGKGSSAAGLTASVVKDRHGEYYLEGGAMVLADGGVVCIDEFDKMRDQDRVAIHEAMEQQTISIAKAGITTILSSRVSVLAAANPVHGRYNDDITAAQNIDFLPSILSRFDLIFIVRDIRNEERDSAIARHVMGVHMNGGNVSSKENGEIDLLTMMKYIDYCRKKIAPRLSDDAAMVLRNHYVRIRKDMRHRTQENDATVPITVRQLEAITRIAESLAKMSLRVEASEEDVNEAIRLFKVSTMHAASSGSLMGEGMVRPEIMKEVQMIEDSLKRRVSVGAKISQAKVVKEFTKQGYTDYAIHKAIHIMVRRGDMDHRMQRKLLVRVR